MQLSKHFSEEEFLRSETAKLKGINNTWEKPEHKLNAIKLCNEVLEPLREQFGALKITSGYRNKRLNIAIGGASKSKHLTGEAADIFPIRIGVRLQDIYEYLNKHHKGGVAIRPNRFIHVDIGENRRWTY